MKKQIFFSLLSVLAMIQTGLSQGHPLVLTAGKDTVASGAVACVPVTVEHFTDIITFQHSMTWNPQVLTFSHIQNLGLGGLSVPNSFNTATPGRLLTGWDSDNFGGISLNDQTVLYEVCFTATGANNTSTVIQIGGEGFPPTSGGAEAINESLVNVWTPNSGVSGLVVINNSVSTQTLDEEDAALRVFPNPAEGSVSVCFMQQNDGRAIISVTDLMGRVILESETWQTPGNICESITLPAELSSGNYLLIVQTADGRMVSEALSVAK